MSNIAVQGGATGTGTVTILAPSTSTDRTLTLPDATGTVLSTASISVVTPAMLTQPLTLGTAVASTSGTSIDFNSIPSWAKRITVMFSGVSTNGSSFLQVQIGTGGVPTTSGYLGSVSYLAGGGAGTNSFTPAFQFVNAISAGNVFHGQLFLILLDASTNKWTCSSSVSRSDSVSYVSAGQVALSGALNFVRITTANGTDTFDAGSINILYEG